MTRPLEGGGCEPSVPRDSGRWFSLELASLTPSLRETHGPSPFAPPPNLRYRYIVSNSPSHAMIKIGDFQTISEAYAVEANHPLSTG
jgi:hypothetical protein